MGSGFVWQTRSFFRQGDSDHGRMRSAFEQSAPEHGHRTMNFSLIKGGEVVNQVPDYVEGIFDIRFLKWSREVKP